MNRKKIIFISMFSLLILIVCAVLFLFFNKNKTIEVNKLEVIEALSKENSALATKQIKENIVKISNEIDNNTIIYGTGFFDKSGYLVTNSHVVDVKGDITVTYFDGKKSEATLVSNDIISDLAILSVRDVKAKALPFKSTLDLEITDEVYSIGYQLNLEGDASVTKGILSAKRVASGIEFLQTDAAVNSGGSGGPVINAKGEVLGMITLASENATLSFAVSSDTLELYISKLINNKNITYITEKRNANALSSVLKEVNYKDIDDIYNENRYLKKHIKDTVNKEEIKNELKHEDKKHNHINKKEEQNNQPKPIIPNRIEPILLNSTIPTRVEDYFSSVEDLSKCKLDISNVNVNKVGKYKVYVECPNNNKSSLEIEIYGQIGPNKISVPSIQMDETQNNVTSIDQIKGVWYYPGYRDVCSVFSLNRGIYEWSSYSHNPYDGGLFYNYGGGSLFRTEEELFSQAKFWVSGNFLVITTQDAQYTLTRIKGEGVYDERFYFDSYCD